MSWRKLTGAVAPTTGSPTYYGAIGSVRYDSSTDTLYRQENLTQWYAYTPSDSDAIITSSGTIELSGSADSHFEFDFTVATSGSMSISGGVEIELTKHFLSEASGGMTFGGDAAEIEWDNHYIKVASGTVNVSGSATVLEENFYIAEGSGSITAAGNASVDIDIPVTGSGSLPMSGNGAVDISLDFVGSGSLPMSGDATESTEAAASNLYVVGVGDIAFGSQPEVIKTDTLGGSWTTTQFGTAGYSIDTDFGNMNSDGSVIFIRTNNGATAERYTYDGSSFTDVTSTSPSGAHYPANSEFLIWDNSGATDILKSTTDFSSYTDEEDPSTISLRIVWNGSVYAGIDSSSNIYYSSDLSSWTQATTSISNVQDLAVVGSTFILVTSAPAIYSSTDGDTWTSRTAAGLTITGGLYFARVNGTRFEVSALAGDYSSAECVYSEDGATWSSYTLPVARDLTWTMGSGLFGSMDSDLSDPQIYSVSGTTFSLEHTCDADQIPFCAAKITA